MLRYQLNPHFLFNTLNAISTLILDNEGSREPAVSRLSDFLRYSLDQDPMKKVTLRQEIDALDLYLATEHLRFGDRLSSNSPSTKTRRGPGAVAAAAATGRELAQIRGLAVRTGRPARIEAREQQGSSARRAGRRTRFAGGRRARRRPWRRPPQYARAACRALRRPAEFAVRSSKPGLRIEILLPFEMASQPT